MMYTLMVEATNIAGNNPPQYASDIVGPLILTGGSSGCTYSQLFIFKLCHSPVKFTLLLVNE